MAKRSDFFSPTDYDSSFAILIILVFYGVYSMKNPFTNSRFVGSKKTRLLGITCFVIWTAYCFIATIIRGDTIAQAFMSWGSNLHFWLYLLLLYGWYLLSDENDEKKGLTKKKRVINFFFKILAFLILMNLIMYAAFWSR